MRASKDPPTMLELCEFFQKKRALESLTPNKYSAVEEVPNPGTEQTSSQTRAATSTKAGQAINKRRMDREELAPRAQKSTSNNSGYESECQVSCSTPVSSSRIVEVPLPWIESSTGSRGGAGCWQKAMENEALARHSKEKCFNLQSLENRSKAVMVVVPHQFQKQAQGAGHDRGEHQAIGRPSGGTLTNPTHRQTMKSAAKTFKLPPIQQTAKETATPSYTVKPEKHTEYSEDKKLPCLDEETRLSSQVRTATAATATTSQEAYKPRKARLVLVMSKKHTPNNGYTSKPGVSFTAPVPKSSASLPALAETPPQWIEASDGSRSGAHYFQTAEANVGRDGNKNYIYHQSPEVRRRGNVTIAPSCRAQEKAPDGMHYFNEGKTEKNKMTAIGGQSRATETNQAHQRKLLSARSKVQPQQPKLHPPIPPYPVSPEECDGIQSLTRCRRIGRQELCNEPTQERIRRQGVCRYSESSPAGRTFLRVVNKRF